MRKLEDSPFTFSELFFFSSFSRDDHPSLPFPVNFTCGDIEVYCELLFYKICKWFLPYI